MKKHIVVLICFVSFIGALRGQGNLTPVNNAVYGFLESMSVKGLITENAFSKPLSRFEIAACLNALNAKKTSLDPVENERLLWYQKEYTADCALLSGQTIDDAPPAFLHSSAVDRLRLFYYRKDEMRFSFSPILGLSFRSAFDETGNHLWNGFSSYGTLPSNLGFQIDFRDNSLGFKQHIESPNYSDRETGQIVLKQTGSSLEFSETNGAFLYENNWLTFGSVKEHLNWGSGYSSQIIMSSKAPSFPSIYLKLHPVDWLQFYYLHGWLISRVHDSLASYSSQIAGRPRNIDRPKYIAMHALQINPWKNLAYTIGETITYSDWSPYWGYLMPFVFYRSVDHSFEGGTGENTGNNGSIFFDIKYFPAAKVKCFTTVFIDEMSVSDLLKGDNARNQIAYSIGSAIYNLLIPRLFVRAEYTRIQPWVYSNFVQTQTYTNANYLMGHYIGQNADQFYVRIDYAFLHNLNVSFSAERTRQGGFGAVQYQYDYIAEEFLYGLNRNETAFTLEARYEYTHDLTAEAFLRFTNIKDEDISRTPDWRRGSFTNFGLSLYYGL